LTSIIFITIILNHQVGGSEGAGAVAELLKARGVRLEVIVDEGGIIIEDGFPPFTDGPIAIVGTSEKVCWFSGSRFLVTAWEFPSFQHFCLISLIDHPTTFRMPVGVHEYPD
jgi:hypothetical protein